MTDYDPELEIIKAKKLLKMKKKITEEKPKPKTDRDLFIAHLVDRGTEVLAAAEAQYPRETAMIVAKIAELIKNGELQSMISGGELLALFRSIGLRVRMNTKISIEEHGKLVSLSDRLKSKED
ncbi:MAG: DNA-binding protein [Nitrososphaerales archaeon]